MRTEAAAAALGEVNTALEHFERSAALGVIRAPLGHDMHSDPLLDPLRGHPRFELVNRGEWAQAEDDTRTTLSGESGAYGSVH